MTKSNKPAVAPASRAGFTLVELMLVLAIIVIIAVVLVPVALRMQERNQVSRAVSLLQGLLAEARGRAMAEKKACGLRLIPMNFGQQTTAAGIPAFWYDRVQFIEQPGDFNEGWVWAVHQPAAGPVAKAFPMPAWRYTAPGPFFPMASPPTLTGIVNVTPAYQVPTNNRIYAPFRFFNVDTTVVPNLLTPTTVASGFGQIYVNTPFSFVGPAAMPPIVNVGDLLEINGMGQLFEITGINSPAGLIPSFVTVTPPITRDILPPMNGWPNYRIIRRPRPIPNLPVIKLPNEVVVDLNSATNPAIGPAAPADRDTNNTIWMRGISQGIPALNTAPLIAGTVDIVFNPSGQVIQAPADLMYIWMHPSGSPDAWLNRQPTAASSDPDNQALLVIYSRTGAIGSFRVNQNLPGTPWDDARRGRAEGIGGL